MYNNVTMMGRISTDLELETTPNGLNVCSFRIAVERQYHPKGEERKVDFFNVVAWRNTAEFVTKYFRKGSMIMVIGELQTRPYTDRSGNNSIWYEIIANRICFTGEKHTSESTTPTYSEQLSDTAPPPEESSATAQLFGNTDDNYPF